MIESMACGTPVVAYRRGAVPEVVEHGRSGIVVEPRGDVATALREAAALDRGECRRAAEERFSAGRMVKDYLRAYEAAAEGVTVPPPPIER
jgi:glycosyltransferase involved in cell wall biosynthesis